MVGKDGTKRQQYSIGTAFKKVKTWQLVLILLLMCFVAATFLRLNNVGMDQRRSAVLAADKNGDSQETHERLYDLQRYSIAHMNADTGALYLQGQYDRDAKAVTDAIQQQTGGGTSVNARADAICKPLSSGYSKAYQDCMIREITKAGQVADPANVPKYPNPALYRYSFMSPAWSPDFAGFSVLICIILLIIIIVRLISVFVLKILLKRSYRGI